MPVITQDTAEQRLTRILEEEAGEQLLPAARARILRRFAESRAAGTDPLRVLQDEGVRDDVAESRVIRRLAATAERLRHRVEKGFDLPIEPGEYVDAGGLAQVLQSKTLGLLNWIVQESVFDVSVSSAVAILEAAASTTRPVLVVPHVPAAQEILWGDDLDNPNEWRKVWDAAPWEGEGAVSVAAIQWGMVQAVQDACLHILREVDEGEKREAGLDRLQELHERGRMLHALARLQELLASAICGPLLEPRDWQYFATESEAEEEKFAYRVLADPPQAVALVQALTLITLDGSLQETLADPQFREALGTVGVRVSLMAGSDEDPAPFGYKVAVNDPYVSLSSIERAVRDARAEVQRRTEEPKLAPDDREFLNLVAEVEEEHGIGPDDRRPHGFWSVVRERWNEDHPDRTLKPSAIRTWWHRKGPTTAVRSL